VIGLRAGLQEPLAVYLRDYLLYRPCIHCVGAALGFLSGDEDPIPDWARKFQLGWLARLIGQPRMLLPRFALALSFAAIVLRYRSELPPLRTRWTDI
jgi:UDP-N-acetyl-D-mannosaminuronic acid transferase (WecB/TagA/CpsF family)